MTSALRSSPDGELSPPLRSGTTTAYNSPLPLGRSRKTVSRACDWCRARRIKCDNGQPCKACHQRGVACTQNGGDGPRTLPQAMREIDKLKVRVKELEAELSRYKSLPQSQPALMPTPESAPSFQSSSPGAASSLQSASPCAPKPQWKGIHVATTRSDQPAYYGPASLFYFVSRVGCYLGKALHQPHADRSFQTRGASKNMHLSDSDGDTAREDHGTSADVTAINDQHSRALGRAQEETLLKLFWEGYHCLFAVVDETDFRKHYASLWEPGRNQRKHSPLADIILALCLQYGYAFIPRHITHPTDCDATFGDAAVAGRWYYRRCQSLLTADLESPSITTVQCYLFTIAYLCCASFQNMTHIVTAQALRTAQVLGLHLEPPMEMPQGQRELRKRIWWQVLTLEAKIGAKMGRPFLVDWSQVTVTLPSDDAVTASYNQASLSSYAPSQDVSWLSYAVYNQKLFLTMVGVYDALYDNFGQVMQQKSLSSPYTDPEALESCAKFLATKISTMWTWADNVPEQLKLRRRSGGEAYSTDRTAVEMDMLAPIWLQRQRVCLELMYHSTIANLTRPFISFYSHSNTYTPITERQANLCVNHAISYTLIMHQVLTESDILGGWSEFFFLQWNAAISIVGFVLAYPIHPTTPKARSTIDKAIAIFDIFGANFAVSADAARIVRDLAAKADLLAGGGLNTSLTSSAISRGDAQVGAVSDMNNAADGSLAWLDPSRQNDLNYFNQEVMDWALSIDSYNNFDNFFDASNPVDPWLFGQS